jgi:N-acetylmuramoyl-L-alanine amidase
MRFAPSIAPGTRPLLLLLLLGGALACPAAAPAEPQSRQELAHAQYERAQRLQVALDEKPASARTTNEYLRAIHAYRRVYLITPQSGAVTPALMAIGGLYEEMGRRWGARYDQSAVDAYQYLLHQYPKSRYAAQALLAVGRLEGEKLGHPELARRTYQEFLRRFPNSSDAGEAREGLEAIAKARAAPPPAMAPPAEVTSEETPEETPEATAEATPEGTSEEPVPISAIHYRNNPQGTLVTVMAAGAVHYRSRRIRNPDRIYFDLYPAKLAPELRRKTMAIDDGVVKEIRAGQNNVSVVRIVLEPEKVADYSAFLLRDPYRLVINLQSRKTPGAATAAASAAAPDEPPETAPPNAPEGALPPIVPPPLRTGERSLTRTLGLKIGRIVIDPGHGGFDTGTIGPTGLTEKYVCLDVALRLGRLIERKLPGMQVIYTRRDDRFIPLETRTAIANRDQADLFISIHANSSRNHSARGIETYYLNFTASPDALAVATRENALSNRSIHDLQGLLKKIARNDKIEESRELATDVQESLVTKLRLTRLGDESRGVKKAPFVVLIGAHMPSVLVEIAFLSNRTDERLLRQSYERQRIAQALFSGIAKYLASLNSLPRPAPERQAELATHGSGK